MKIFTLTLEQFGKPLPQDFKAPNFEAGLWFARGYVAAFIGRDEPSFLGSKWRLDLTPTNNIFDDRTWLGSCEVIEQDGAIGQSWVTRVEKRPGTDMDVGDPHDAPPERPTPRGPVRKRAAGKT